MGKKKQGFTLIELMVVISIMGILASIGTYSWNKRIKITQVRGQVLELQQTFNVATAYARKYRQNYSIHLQENVVTVYNDTACVDGPGTAGAKVNLSDKMTLEYQGTKPSVLDVGTEWISSSGVGCVNFYPVRKPGSNRSRLGESPIDTSGFMVIKTLHDDVDGMLVKRHDDYRLRAYYRTNGTTWLKM